MQKPKNNNVVFFAETTFRKERKKFGIKLDDRRKHVYIIGKTGMGKTSMMENMAIQDIQQGRGLCFIDPHGESAERLLEFVPSERVNDVIYFNPADIEYPITFNVMESVAPESRHLVASGLMGVFKKIWPDVWSARMEYILNNAILALLEYPGSTLLGANRMLADADFRAKVVSKITDPVIKSFWVKEFARYTDRYEVEATAAIQNKIGQFISAPLIRNIIGQVKSKINMREIMDNGKIMIVNLSKGKMGEDVSLLIGGLLITKLQLAAMSRVEIPEQERKDFFLYVDEFQNFATRAFVTILSEARKYRLCICLGHQYITQMEEEVADAVFGNVGTIVSFRVGADDAEYLEKEFLPEFEAQDLVNLAKYDIYLKLMIDGVAGRPFSAKTLSPFPASKKTNTEKIKKVSRERYGMEKGIVEEKIKKWLGFLEDAVPPTPSTNALHDAKCSLCGKNIKVIFPPDGVRPVYCKSCLKKAKKEPRTEQRTENAHLTEAPAAEPVSLKDALKQSPVFFNPSQKKQKATADVKGLREVLSEVLKKKEEQKTPHQRPERETESKENPIK